tara:strand:+ start:2208 stop:2513 length:306 start_codon:yes stop_codon:yes gene_type:complete
MSSTPAWQRKEGKSPSGGLNEKGRRSYKGGTLKAPTKSKTSARRKSFCARMKGMKKKLTSAKTARDPDSRINKSLRKWDCNTGCKVNYVSGAAGGYRPQLS